MNLLFPTFEESTKAYNDMLISRNGWRLLALVQLAAFAVILINYYGFGVRA